MGTNQKKSHPLLSRTKLIAAAVALGALALLASACAPPEEPVDPQAPKVSVVVSLTDASAAVSGAVRADAVVTRVPDIGDATVTWSFKDLRTGQVVFTTEGPGSSVGLLSRAVQAGLFKVEVNGSTASVQVEASVKVDHAHGTLIGSDSELLEWQLPGSPVAGSVEATSSYNVIANTLTTCAPVGTNVHLSITGETSHAFGGFLDMTNPPQPLGTLVPFDSDNELSLTTTEPCWSVVIARLSFSGGLSGITNYSVSW